MASVQLGAPYQGGIIFYIFEEVDLGYVEGEVHGLITAKEDQSAEAEWGWFNTEISGADKSEIGTGALNTLDILMRME